MTDITVRSLDFRFEEDIDYYWNPGNDDWGNFVNLITLIVPAFERFVIKATLDDDRIKLKDVFLGALPFAFVMLLVLILLIWAPALSTALLN